MQVTRLVSRQLSTVARKRRNDAKGRLAVRKEQRKQNVKSVQVVANDPIVRRAPETTGNEIATRPSLPAHVVQQTQYQQQPPSFFSQMKTYLVLGIGMTLGMTFVGVIGGLVMMEPTMSNCNQISYVDTINDRKED